MIERSQVVSFDKGIASAKSGGYGTQIIRAVPRQHSEPAWHSHDLDFQMVSVTRGWVVFEYKGRGGHILREISCVM